jgi:hypothetical protein
MDIDDGLDATTLLQTTVHQVVTEWLRDPVERIRLEKAYDAMIVCCHSSYAYNFIHNNVETLSDLYRALLVTSLLLRLDEYHRHSPETCQCLEDSVERSLVLLQILVAAPTAHDLVEKLPQSRYPLLNALLQEPLVPLCRTDRQDLWWSTATNDNEEEDDDEEEGVLSIPDKKQLAREEQQLLRMARRPIPEPTSREAEDLQQQVDNNSIHLQLKNDKCIPIPIPPLIQKGIDVSALQQQVTIPDTLRQEAHIFWG